VSGTDRLRAAALNACPVGTQWDPEKSDDCIAACAESESVPGYAELDALGSCTKDDPYENPGDAYCGWPSPPLDE
jgi:hypothetical protein